MQSDDLGYVIGVVFTDGSVYRTKFKRRLTLPSGNRREDEVTQVRVALQCKDRPLAARFAAALGRLTGRTPRIRPFERTFPKSTLKGGKHEYVFHGFEVKMAAKELGLVLMEAKADRAAFIAKCSEKLLRPMLVGVVDGDGHYHSNKHIVITQKDSAWVEALCDRLSISYRSYRYPYDTCAHLTIGRADSMSIDTYKRPKPRKR